VAERYSVSLKDGYHQAQQVMEDEITTLIHRDIGGDHQRIDWRKTKYVGVTFKHTLLPIWVANYRYRERLFQVLVNGRTARVAGDRPWSWWKIVGLGLVIFLAILLVLVLVSTAKGQVAGSERTESTRRAGMGEEIRDDSERIVALSPVGTGMALAPTRCARTEVEGPAGNAAGPPNRQGTDRYADLYDPTIPDRIQDFWRFEPLRALDHEP
jgi:hypothetical protein